MSSHELPIHVETIGVPDGPETDTVLLLHGYGGCSFTWRYWAPRLAERTRVLLVDLKGFGLAPKPLDDRYAIDDQAELVCRLIQERDLRRLTLVGHSLGGAIALRTALRLLDTGESRLRRMVLVAGAAYPQPLPPFVGFARRRWVSKVLFRLLGADFIVRRVLKSIVYDPAAVTDEQVRGYAEPLRSPGAFHALMETALRVVPDDMDRVIGRFPEIDVPTLLLWGETDPAVPTWVGHRLKAELPNATLHVFGQCGHMPAEELPEESWDRLEAFLWPHNPVA